MNQNLQEKINKINYKSVLYHGTDEATNLFQLVFGEAPFSDMEENRKLINEAKAEEYANSVNEYFYLENIDEKFTEEEMEEILDELYRIFVTDKINN